MTLINRRLVAAATATSLSATVLVSLALTQGQGSASAVAHPAPALFAAAPAAAARTAPDFSLSTPKRARYVSFRSSVLPAKASGQKVSLPFFRNASFTGSVEHIDRQALLTSWSGSLDTADGTFVVTESAGRYNVTASTTQGSFTMDVTRSGLYQVKEVDQPQVDGHDTVSPPAAASSTTSSRVAALAAKGHRSRGGDDGSVEDILVVYTKAAKAAYGGLAGIQAEAAKNIGYTNAAYANSGVRTTARLVGVVPTKTKELGGAGIDTDLTRLINRRDRAFRDVFKYINKTHADDTILLVKPPPRSAPVCGIAAHVKNQPFKYAFGVVSTGECTDGYYSFPHELGHNQGAAHDLWTLRHDPVGRGRLDAQFRYGYGYVAPNFAFYTTMAYYSQCRYVGHVYCPQLLGFSNPAVAYGGQVTGTKGRNNVAKLISKTRKRVAGHQQSQLYPTPVRITPKPVFHHGRVRAAFPRWVNGGVRYSYRWYLNGQKIRGAKKATYQPRKKDIGGSLSVVVTGKKRFYTPVAVGSAARLVKGGAKRGGKQLATGTAPSPVATQVRLRPNTGVSWA